MLDILRVIEFVSDEGDCPDFIRLRLRSIMIDLHFHANMKVQTAMCKNSNNSKSRAATCVKFDMYKK